MGVDETLARAKEAIARMERERAEKRQALFTAWARDAKKAWDEGHTYYQPVILAHSVGGTSETQRGLQVEVALDAITASGWQLHTWSVAPMGSLVNAHPLFIRGQ
jgi:hypothetical protein